MIVNEKTKKYIPEDCIVYVESSGAYSLFYTINYLNKNHVYAQTLKSIEARASSKFIRIHQSYLVNSRYVSSFNETSVFIEKLNLSLPIAKRRRKEVHEHLAKFLT